MTEYPFDPIEAELYNRILQVDALLAERDALRDTLRTTVVALARSVADIEGRGWTAADMERAQAEADRAIARAGERLLVRPA